jgi:hypothetical protein
MDTEKQKELWERLENEPERAYRAFENYLTLPTGDRTLLEAYRRHVGNSLAVKPSDTWSRWSSQFAWRERAAAYDDHLASLRRGAYERGIEEEAERQGAIAERNRSRMNELMTLGYEESMKWLENKGHEEMRAADVIQLMRLHLDAVKAFGVPEEPKEDEWTEEDDEYVETILKDIKREAHADESDEDEGGYEDAGGC